MTDPPDVVGGGDLVVRGRRVPLRQAAIVMGIVNRTPDSFYDRGETFALEPALRKVDAHARDGAGWIDIGGVPFGPGPEVSAADEIERVLPVVEYARSATDLVISVETTNSEVAAAALDAGADFVNDTSGLHDPKMPATIADRDGGVILVHSAAPPRTAVARPHYDDVVAEVAGFLRDRVAASLAAGVDPAKIVVDPGHDLHKNTLHSLALTRELRTFAEIGPPLLVAVSNKDFIGEALGRPIGDRVIGTVAMSTICLMQGARILRVHNVAEAVTAVQVVATTLGWTPPAELRHNYG